MTPPRTSLWAPSMSGFWAFLLFVLACGPVPRNLSRARLLFGPILLDARRLEQPGAPPRDPHRTRKAG